MTLSLTLACVWALLATFTAFLPMRYQHVPGLALLILAVPLLVFIGVEHSLWVVFAALAGLISMFRRPLWFFGRYLLGRFGKGEG